MKKFIPLKASDLFECKKHDNGVFQNSKKKENRIEQCKFPFDIAFDPIPQKEKKIFHGSGIYMIEFNDKIIYIGKFRPFNKGNIISTRWRAHLETITNRGIHVGGFEKDHRNGKKREILANMIGVEKDLKQLLKGRKRDTGTVTSVKRLEFAKKNWKEFKKEVPLEKFNFHYYQLNHFSSFKEKSSEKELYGDLVSLIEEFLLIKYSPDCNSGINGKFQMKDMIAANVVKKVENDIKGFIRFIEKKIK